MSDPVAAVPAPRRRRPFPGANPQSIGCPRCGRPARTSDDGLIYVCAARHVGYYETEEGTLPGETWRAAPRPIERFGGEFAFLSNFHPSPVALDGVLYATVEHAYQAAKTDDPAQRERIRRAPTPGRSKRLGRRVTLRAGWESEQVPVMRGLVRRKFARHAELAERLRATGGHELVEGNDWGDRFWGVCGEAGENRLGQILMEVRAHLAGRRDAGERR